MDIHLDFAKERSSEKRSVLTLSEELGIARRISLEKPLDKERFAVELQPPYSY
jgi:hypothetical protein